MSIQFDLYIYHIFIAYVSIGKWGLVICFLFQRRLRLIFAQMILWSEDTH